MYLHYDPKIILGLLNIIEDYYKVEIAHLNIEPENVFLLIIIRLFYSIFVNWRWYDIQLIVW